MNKTSDYFRTQTKINMEGNIKQEETCVAHVSVCLYTSRSYWKEVCLGRSKEEDIGKECFDAAVPKQTALLLVHTLKGTLYPYITL